MDQPPKPKRHTTNPFLIAIRLRKLKSKSMLTSEELAEELGAGIASVWRWLAGTVAPHPRMQRRIEQVERKFGIRNENGELK
jgi:transcriptional regulator with XRE-family HTH domain